jgi:hypothetical protein
MELKKSKNENNLFSTKQTTKKTKKRVVYTKTKNKTSITLHARRRFYLLFRQKYLKRRFYFGANFFKKSNEVLVRPQIRSRLISKELSFILHKKVRVKLKNVFTYLVQKRRLNKRK